MKVHEYQGKEIFRNHGIATPKGVAVFNIDEALNAYDSLNSKTVVVKRKYTQEEEEKEEE